MCSGTLPDRPASIFFLIRSLNLGGAERQLIQLASGLKTRGHEVTVAVYYEGELDREVRSAGVRLLNLGKQGRWDLARFAWRLIKAIRSTKPDILYSFLGTSNILAALIRPFVPSLKLVWSVRASNMDVAAYDRVSRLSYRLECALSRRPDLIISNSRAGADYAVLNGFPVDRMLVVPNGIDIERFRPDGAAREAMREKWGVSSSQVLIGVLARLDPMKDYPTFLRAAARIAATHPAVRFACVGADPDDHGGELKNLAASLGLDGRVSWPGPLADPVAALNAFDIYCSASAWGEGFSNSVAEAMACDVPCVVTDVGDSAMIVGSTGRVVPPGQDKALSQALAELVDELGSQKKPRARERIERCFSIERLVAATEQAILGELGDYAKAAWASSKPASTPSQNCS